MSTATLTPYIGRLAPSTTGFLHLGHARTFWIAHQRARAAHGKLCLRDEDLDPQRSRPEFSAAIKEDLRWLGITWDEELRQSDRLPLYRAALQQLLDAGLSYPCTCSRRDVAQSIHAPHEDTAAAGTDDEPLYNNRCRPNSNPSAVPAPVLSQGASSRPEAQPERRGRPPTSVVCSTGCRDPCIQPVAAMNPHANYRLRTRAHEAITFTDLNAGPQAFTTGVDFGDFLIWRKPLTSGLDDIGLPSYQLACVVDDALTGVTEIVRGRDLLKSTARQILLQRALSLPTPATFHCDLLRDPSGIRLAKRHDALSLRNLRASGLTPARIIDRF